MTFPERDVIAILAELVAVHEGMYKLSWVRELAESHKQEQMLSVGMREKAATWKREDGFDRSETIAERHHRTLRRRMPVII